MNLLFNKIEYQHIGLAQREGELIVMNIILIICLFTDLNCIFLQFVFSCSNDKDPTQNHWHFYAS